MIRFLPILLLAMVALALPAAAQQRGDMQSSTSSLPFITSGQSVWGAGTQVGGPDWSHSVFDLTYDVGLKESDTESWEGLKFGGGVDMTTKGSLGLSVGLRNASVGSLGITYPVGATLRFPAANSFARGEPVTIETGWAVEDGARIDSDAPAQEVYLDAPFGNSSNITFQLCVFSCTDNTSIPPWGIPTQTHTILAASQDGITVGDQAVDVTRWDFTIIESVLLGISGYVATPDDYPSGGSLSGNTLSASKTDRWIDSRIDLDKLLTRLGVPVQGGTGVNLGDFSIGYNFYDFDLDLDFYHTRSFAFEGTPSVTFTLPVSVDWWVTTPGGDFVSSGTGTTASLDVGNSLNLIFPEGRADPLSASTVYNLDDNAVSSVGQYRFAGGVRDTLLSAELYIAGKEKEIRKAKFGWKCAVAQSVCDLTAKVIGDIWEWVQTGWNYFQHTFGTVDARWGPKEAKTLTTFDDPVDYFSDSWTVGGFSSLAGGDAVFDPEDPSIAVSTSMAASVLATSAHEGMVTQTILVENTGDVALNSTALLDALAPSGLGLEDLQSFDLTVNPAFDGSERTSVLADNQTVPVGGTATVTLRWTVVPGLYEGTVEAAGTSPIGTDVTASAPVAFGWLAMDIKPDALNRKSQGQLPVDLYGTPGLSVRDISQGSLALEGVAPNQVQVEDTNLDGIPDLKLRFDRPAVIAGMDARIAALAQVLAAAEVVTPTFELQEPEFSADEVAEALLRGGAGFTHEQILTMDRSGNGNGRLDVGDLRAAVLDGGWVLAMAKGGGGKGGGLGSGAPPEDFIFVLTGNLNDGTPFWAEDHAMVQGDAR